MDDLIAKGQVAWSGSSWSRIGVAPAGTSTGGDHAHGFYQPTAGRFFGKGATAGDNKQCPAEGIVSIPATGYRNNSNGATIYAGEYGHWWTASSDGSSFAIYWCMGSRDAIRGGNGSRPYGFPVRCVK